jgi:hypothetical protein
MKPTLLPAAPFLLLLCALPFPASAADYTVEEDVLVASFWTELNPMVSLEGPGQIDRDAAIRRVLEEARMVLSGMVYGYRVRYVPLDRRRQVAEEFSMEPIARIEKGDERLRVLNTRTEKERFYVRVRYDLAEYQQRRRQMWRSNTIPDATARGTAPISEGYRGKYAAFEEGVKQALRAHLRPREFNKPREIRGEVLYLEPPAVTIDAGGYHAKVRVKIRLEEVLPYSVY